MKSFAAIFLFLLTSINNTFLIGQVTIETKFIDHESLRLYNFEGNEYANYERVFRDSLSAFFANNEKEQSIRVIRTLDTKFSPYFAFSGRPQLTDSAKHALQKALMGIPPINANHIVFSTEYMVLVNGGCTDRKIVFSPNLVSIEDIRRNKYQFASLQNRFDYVKDWSLKGFAILLEILEEQAVENGDAEFFLKQIKSEDFRLKKDLQAIIDYNPIYWKASEELLSYPRLIPVIKVMLLVSQGQFRYAKAYSHIISHFEDEGSLLNYLLGEIHWQIAYYLQNERLLLNTNLIVLTSKNSDALLKISDSILLINPNSTKALIYSISILDQRHSILSEKSNFRKQVLYASNPIHSDTLIAYSKQAAYLNFVRKSTDELFIDTETFSNDFQIYAEKALELKAYAFAADLYWILKEKKETAKKYYYFALRKLISLKKEDRKTISKTFKRDNKRIDKRFRKRMKRHPIYKTFNKS